MFLHFVSPRTGRRAPKFREYLTESSCELGRVTEGTIVFTDEEHDVVIEMIVNEDNPRVAHVYRAGVEVGIVYVDVNGETTYEDLIE